MVLGIREIRQNVFSLRINDIILTYWLEMFYQMLSLLKHHNLIPGKFIYIHILMDENDGFFDRTF